MATIKTTERMLALVVGAGSGLSASIARRLAASGARLGLVARDVGKLAGLAGETGAETFAADASDPEAVRRLFDDLGARLGIPDVVVYNASGRTRGALASLDAAAVRQDLLVTAFGGFLVGQQAARLMAERGSGVILFTGASASVKGYARSASFAMGKFALRGLAQSMARELGPLGIHVAHVVVDGGIAGTPGMPASEGDPDGRLSPDAIADAYLHLIAQPRSAWTHELDLRPWSERF